MQGSHRDRTIVHTLRLQSVIVGKSQGQELEAAGHLASAVKAERKECVHDNYSASFSCSYTVQAQSLANGAIDFQSCSSLRQPAADMLRGWPGLDNPFWSSLSG